MSSETVPPVVLTSRRILIEGAMGPGSLHLKNGVIDAIQPYNNLPAGVPVLDYGNLVIGPSFTDAHVHINEPGRTHWEGFETATKAAAAGGITTLIDMPLNSSPLTTSVQALEIKRSAANGKLWVDCGFYGGIIPGNESEIPRLVRAGVRGFKAFLCHSGLDEFPNATEKELRTVMPLLAMENIPVLVHAELADFRQPINPGDERMYTAYMNSRPQKMETAAIEMMIQLCRETGCPVHIVHLAASDALPAILAAKKEGLPLTVETAPHYLFFSTDEIPDGDVRFKCAPPIRNKKNRDSLRIALMEGYVDFVATDHSPASPDVKEHERGNLVSAWGGISSLQLLMPALWSSVKHLGASPADIHNWLSHKPSAFINREEQPAGLRVGQTANLVVWNPDESFPVTADLLQHRHKLTPYDGEKLYGKVESTWLRGRQIYSNSGLQNKGYGKLV